MVKIHLATFNILVISCFFLMAANAQTTKTHTQKFNVNEDVSIHVNTTHTNVKFETWDKNEVEVTFTLEADEKVEELFEKWNFEATGNSDKVTIGSKSGYHFDMNDFQFNFDMDSLNLNHIDIDIPDFNFDFDFDNMVGNIMTGLNLEDMPPSPFGKEVSFDGNRYRKSPEAYLKKLNDKHGTNVTQKQADQWMDDLKKWADEIEVNIDNTQNIELHKFDERFIDQTKELQESVEKWQKENESQIKEMTDKIEKQIENMNFDQFKNFNHFDQDKSNIKKTIRIRLPKKAKLNLNIRYGEVTLAENLRNINADLNYASLSANTINGEGTDISSSFAPIFVKHWEDGHLNLNYCNDIIIKKATKIDINAQGTDILIGTLLNSGLIHNAYGDLEIQQLGVDLKDLNLVLDYSSALLHLSSNALDVKYKGNRQSVFSLPKKCKILSDNKEGVNRIVKAYNQKRNSGNVLSILANYGELTIK